MVSCVNSSTRSLIFVRPALRDLQIDPQQHVQMIIHHRNIFECRHLGAATENAGCVDFQSSENLVDDDPQCQRQVEATGDRQVDFAQGVDPLQPGFQFGVQLEDLLLRSFALGDMGPCQSVGRGELTPRTINGDDDAGLVKNRELGCQRVEYRSADSEILTIAVGVKADRTFRWNMARGELRDGRFVRGGLGGSLSRLSFLQGNEPSPHGVADQFGLVLEPEFPHQVGAMVLDRPLADVETRSDVSACLPLGCQLQYLALSRSQCFVRVELGGPGLLDVGVDGALRNRRAEKPPPGGRLPHCTDKVLLVTSFEYVAGCTVLERFRHERIVVMHGKHHDAGSR